MQLQKKCSKMEGVQTGKKASEQRSGLRAKWIRFAAFGVGHVQNDLCAAIWFTYFLIFYQQVLSKLAVLFNTNWRLLSANANREKHSRFYHCHSFSSRACASKNRYGRRRSVVCSACDIFSCGHATLQEALSVRWSVRWSVGLSVVIKLKCAKTSILDAALAIVCVCE